MNLASWRRHHKWAGIAAAFFLLMFAISGIVLNHRAAVADAGVSRGLLPARYRFKAWNGGLMRGTVKTDSLSGALLVYGAAGIWKTDTACSAVADFNTGLPSGPDHRNIRAVVRGAGSELFAVSIHDLYRYDGASARWVRADMPADDGELLSDVAFVGDTLAVAGRSFIYLSAPPFTTFEKVQLQAPEDFDGKVSAFRTVWLLHSGELFGVAGKIVVDAIAVVFAILCLTGLILWLLPKYIRNRRAKGDIGRLPGRLTRASMRWHNSIGRLTIILTALTALTGWCLRPPVMVPLALSKIPAIPGTTQVSHNPWHDKLRMIRYDESACDWLLSTSDGFFSLANLSDVPRRVDGTPPVSVMGLNVFQPDTAGCWLCGSFSGLYLWDRNTGHATDYFTGRPAANAAGPPVGDRPIAGYSADFVHGGVAVDYYDGAVGPGQPQWMSTLPMPLWNLALEIHSGRIYIGSIATYVFVFIVGAPIIWCLISGWKIRRKH